jgi:signal transduction histidine kinase
MLQWIRRPGWYAAGTTLVAACVGILVFVVVRGSALPEDPSTVPPIEALRISLLLFGDLLLGLLGVAALPLALWPWAESRPRTAVIPVDRADAGPGPDAASARSLDGARGGARGWALAAGLLTVATTVVSSLAVPACVVVLASFAGRRPRWWFGVASAAFTLATLANAFLVEPVPLPWWWLVLGLTWAMCGVCWLVGAVRRGRRALVQSLRQEAATARREWQAHAEQVRAAERTRIAREMHDSLSHRLSLISLHAGALEYRSALDAETLQRTAGVVRETARTASQELRSVLSVLREEDHPTSPDASPAALQDLVDTARDCGTPVEVTTTGPLAGPAAHDLPAVLSRAVYRFVQECLTNARTHAPHAPVRLALTGEGGTGLVLTAGNPLPPLPAGSGSDSQNSQDSRGGRGGYGLVGLRERFELLDGRLTVHATPGEFTVEGRLPWPS